MVQAGSTGLAVTRAVSPSISQCVADQHGPAVAWSQTGSLQGHQGLACRTLPSLECSLQAGIDRWVCGLAGEEHPAAHRGAQCLPASAAWVGNV